MSDPFGNWRPSLNVQMPRADALRRNWLDEAALAPDAYRQRQGLSPLSADARSAALQQYAPEMPDYGKGPDYFGQGRPAQNVAPESLPPLGALGFRQQADDAAFADQIGGLLQGRGQAPADPRSQFETALSATPLARLGMLYRSR